MKLKQVELTKEEKSLAGRSDGVHKKKPESLRLSQCNMSKMALEKGSQES